MGHEDPGSPGETTTLKITAQRVAVVRTDGSAVALLAGLVDLVERPTVGEVRGLRLCPAAEDLVDGECGHRRERVGMTREHRGVARAVVVFRCDLLGLGR